MLPLLTSDARLPALVGALCAISTPTRCVFVCHGLARSIAAQVASTLRADAQVKVLLVEHSVNHPMLLPNCKAVLHHGGIGTTHACMRAGVPQSKSVVRGYGL
jgi:DNA-nicking Smr family endonuclease